jgi:hypothetical protein
MDSNKTLLQTQIKNQKQALLKGNTSISLTKIVESDQFQNTIHTCRDYRERVFTPLVTL